jgi:hypothetical protein
VKWFDKWFFNKCRQAWDDSKNSVEYEDTPTYSMSKGRRGLVATAPSTRTLESNGVNFRLYTASGGHVVELNHYDSQTDRQTTGLHIIPSSEDLGQSLAHIITVEALKR